MKKLPLATDLSPRSEVAERRALRLAREHGVALTVLHIVDDDLPPSLAEVTRTGAEQIIRARVAALPEGEQVECAIKVLSGKPFSGILAHAAEDSAELIVLGSHRKGGVKGPWGQGAVGSWERGGRSCIQASPAKACWPGRSYGAKTRRTASGSCSIT